MSSYRVKTTYHTLGAYGSIERRTLYARHNNSCDIVDFFDEYGECLFSVESTEPNNLMDAIKRVYSPFKEDGKALKVNVEYWNEQERLKIGI